MLVKSYIQNEENTINVLFNNTSRSTKKLYVEVNKLLFTRDTLPLPDYKDPKTIAEIQYLFHDKSLKDHERFGSNRDTSK